MLSIRLSRVGKRKQPIYRLIVCEKTKDPWGDFLENLGAYNPRTKAANFKADRIKYYLENGAQASATVHNLLVSQGIIGGEKVSASKSKPGKKKAAALASQKKTAEAKHAEEAKTSPVMDEVKAESPAPASESEKPRAK